MKASVTATLRAPKNSGSVFGSAIFQKIVSRDAPSAARMSRYSGSSVERPIETDTAMGKKENQERDQDRVHVVRTDEEQRDNGGRRSPWVWR